MYVELLLESFVFLLNIIGFLTCIDLNAVNLNGLGLGRQSIDDISSGLSENCSVAGNGPLEGIANPSVGNSLPDDEDELLAGIMDDFDLRGLPSSLEDLEDYDLFGSGGGMELEGDPQECLSTTMSKVSVSDSAFGNGLPHYCVPNGAGTVAGEHPYGEHPSRTLFVRNINSNVEDSELRDLFEVIQISKLGRETRCFV